jgi:hypothetical protein
MDELIVPLALAGLQVNGDEAFAEESVARTVAAIVITRGQLNRQIDEA